MELYFADISVCARVLVPIDADSYEDAEQKANEMCSEDNAYEFCESVRSKLMLCEPEIMDIIED